MPKGTHSTSWPNFPDSPFARVNCETSAGPIELKFVKEWSPIGYERAVSLFDKGYYDNTHFFRPVKNFLVQFGITYSTDPELKSLGESRILDDPQLSPPIMFDEGSVSFAGGGPNSRNSQLFIAYGPSGSLGTELWETPLGRVTSGMENIRNLYMEYGDMPPWGKGPKQHLIHVEGEAYIQRDFPLLDKFETCSVTRYMNEKEEQLALGKADFHDPIITDKFIGHEPEKLSGRLPKDEHVGVNEHKIHATKGGLGATSKSEEKGKRDMIAKKSIGVIKTPKMKHNLKGSKKLSHPAVLTTDTPASLSSVMAIFIFISLFVWFFGWGRGKSQEAKSV